MYKLLTDPTRQAKMAKSIDLGYLSAVLQLQPVFRHNGLNTCPNAGHCARTCLQTTGRNRFDSAKLARIRKTKLYIDHRDTFYRALIKDIETLERHAKRLKLKPTVRLNGLSDISFELDNVLGTGKSIFELFPHIQFIDYTKVESRFDSKLPVNYHLTYSVNENTPIGFTDKVFKLGYNCAVVFSGVIPTKYLGKKVFAGDDSDLRHLDPRNYFVGLKYKMAFNQRSGKKLHIIQNGFIN